MTINSIGVLFNVLLIIAIFVDPLKLLRKGAWITIINLAFADLISCVANFMDVGLAIEFHVTDPVTIRIVRFFLIFGVGASFILLTLLTVETYVVTKYPIKGRLVLTGTKTVMLCIAAWILAVPLGLSNIAYLFTDKFSVLMEIYIAQIAFLEVAVFVQVILKMLIIREIMKSRRSTLQQRNNRHKEVAKTIIMLNVILIVTSLPYFVAKQLEFVWKLKLIQGDDLLWRFSNYYEPVAAINYIANPILYALRLPNYKRTLLVPFTKCKCEGFYLPGCLGRRKSEVAANTENVFTLSPSLKNVTPKF